MSYFKTKEVFHLKSEKNSNFYTKWIIFLFLHVKILYNIEEPSGMVMNEWVHKSPHQCLNLSVHKYYVRIGASLNKKSMRSKIYHIFSILSENVWRDGRSCLNRVSDLFFWLRYIYSISILVAHFSHNRLCVLRENFLYIKICDKFNFQIKIIKTELIMLFSFGF